MSDKVILGLLAIVGIGVSVYFIIINQPKWIIPEGQLVAIDCGTEIYFLAESVRQNSEWVYHVYSGLFSPIDMGWIAETTLLSWGCTTHQR